MKMDWPQISENAPLSLKIGLWGYSRPGPLIYKIALAPIPHWGGDYGIYMVLAWAAPGGGYSAPVLLIIVCGEIPLSLYVYNIVKSAPQGGQF